MGHVIECADAPHTRAADEELPELRHPALEDTPEGRRLYRPRHKGGDADPGAEVSGPQTRHVRERRFGDVVSEVAACRPSGAGRAHVEDRGTGAFEQMRDREPGKLERHAHVEVERLLQVLDPRLRCGP